MKEMAQTKVTKEKVLMKWKAGNTQNQPVIYAELSVFQSPKAMEIIFFDIPRWLT